MGFSERKKNTGEDVEIDLKPFINFLVVLIPVLMISAEFAKIAIINLKLPEGRGSQTKSAVTSRPIEDESDKLLLTMIITDSVVTIGAKNGFLPSVFYKEFHKYEYAKDKKVQLTVEIDPKNPKFIPNNPKTGKPFEIGERQEILLYITDSIGKVQEAIYNDKGNLITDENGNALTSVNQGDKVYILSNPRKEVVVTDVSKFTKRPLSAYDEMRNRLMKIKDRYKDVSDGEDIIIAAENQVAYDKIIQLMDVARLAEFPNISIAKLRG